MKSHPHMLPRKPVIIGAIAFILIGLLVALFIEPLIGLTIVLSAFIIYLALMGWWVSK